jgi:hypothetical protein
MAMTTEEPLFLGHLACRKLRLPVPRVIVLQPTLGSIAAQVELLFETGR